MKRVLLLNTAWLGAERVIRFGASVIVMAALARHLGPVQFGALNYATSYVTLFSSLLNLGMNRTLVREFVTSPEDTALLLLVTIRARIGMAVILIATLSGVFTITRDPSYLIATLVAVTALGLLLQAFEPLELWYQSQSRSIVPALIKSGALIATSILKLGLVYWEAAVVAFAWANLIELGVIAIALVLTYRRERIALTGARSEAWSRLGKLLRECWPEIVAGTGTSVCLRLDQIVLEAVTGLSAVGVYAAGVRLSDVWYFVPAAMVSSYYPVLVNARAHNPAQYNRLLQQMFRMVALVAVSIVAITWVTADLLVGIVYGAEYAAAATVLRIHILGLIAMGFGVASGAWIFAEGRARLSMWRTLVGVAVCVPANLLLIPRLGGLGAATATVLSLYAAYFFFDAMPRSTNHIFAQKCLALRPQQLFGTGLALWNDGRREVHKRWSK